MMTPSLYRSLYEAMEQDWRDKGFSEQTMLDLDRHYAGTSYMGPDGHRVSPLDAGRAPAHEEKAPSSERAKSRSRSPNARA